MKVKLSGFLHNQKQNIKELISSLSEDYEYVSLLGTDTLGTRYQLSRTGTSINESSWAERGFVARVYNGGSYSEYSFNETDNWKEIEEEIRRTAAENSILIKTHSLKRMKSPLLSDETACSSFQGEVETHPDEASPELIVDKLTDEMNRGLKMADYLIDLRIIYEYAHVSKIFLSSHRDLEQSYLWSQGYVYPIGQNEKGMRYTYRSFSGLKGLELLEEMKEGVEPAVREIRELLDAERLIPGEYDIICDPSMSGLIAHEAFGHGVEMDMFVKERARAAEYMNKAVASSKVGMHDGARSAEQVSSYLFDDEGTLGCDTVVIRDGILLEGITDLLSAARLGIKPTGNGKRESFERKAYARMTNTFFTPGIDSLDEMIRSTERGYLLENFTSGMEDPKNWGIQCVALKGKEIIKGRLTGKTVAPVYLTGYVPDLLQSISMVSEDLKLSGSGACGKGYKEMVKTSTGGPYLKTRGRLA